MCNKTLISFVMSMKKNVTYYPIFSIIMSLYLILGAFPLLSQNVSIPDTAFLNALIEDGVDTSGDSLISYAEAEAVITLYVGGKIYCHLGGCYGIGNISDLTGIEAFINLDSLFIQGNKIDSIDLSMNNGLYYLNCKYNDLTSLDLSNNTALTHLSCDHNQLTSLDVSGCAALIWLVCSFNQLTTLDVSGCAALIELWCVYNQLTTLDVSNNTALEHLLIAYMPTLYEVCVWESFPAGVSVDTSGSPNVYFTTDCAETDTDKEKCQLPNKMALFQNYPNPFNPKTTIEFDLPKTSNVTLKIFNILGKEVTTLVSDRLTAGSYTYEWDAGDLTSGVYLYSLQAGNFVEIKKMILMK